jgi:hypothetical protein
MHPAGQLNDLSPQRLAQFGGKTRSRLDHGTRQVLQKLKLLNRGDRFNGRFC